MLVLVVGDKHWFSRWTLNWWYRKWKTTFHSVDLQNFSVNMCRSHGNSQYPSTRYSQPHPLVICFTPKSGWILISVHQIRYWLNHLYFFFNNYLLLALPCSWLFKLYLTINNGVKWRILKVQTLWPFYCIREC